MSHPDAERSILHLSLPVADLAQARAFYVETLGCRVGRTEPNRMDVDFFGHHLVLHHLPEEAERPIPGVIAAGDPAPVRHFGAVLPPSGFEALVARMARAGVAFVVPPHTARAGTPGEQLITLVKDGCGNVVEFKGMESSAVFAA
ncbi:VOC family protein [Falsiroseomonas sp. HW251]|uniref:VOC family protein n=1 Tax=Falsiroseomonas sp. HW251 TaxID=3390998 RepID=UPI003D311A80